MASAARADPILGRPCLPVVPVLGTIAPIMGTTSGDLLGTVLFGRTRRAVLAMLYGHPDESFYVRQIGRAAGVGHGALQRELAQLTRAGILTRTVQGKQVYYRANRDCPVYEELRGLLLKTVGVADVLRGLEERVCLALTNGERIESGSPPA